MILYSRHSGIWNYFGHECIRYQKINKEGTLVIKVVEKVAGLLVVRVASYK